MKAKRLVVVLLVGALALGGGVTFKLQTKVKRGEAIREIARQLVMQADVAKRDPAGVGRYFDASHSVGVAGAGSLFGPIFDEKLYYTALFGEMVRLAESEGKQEEARLMRNFAVGRGYVDVKAK